ncbi:hypothetical protein [Nonomuraea sp. LPB2021202275-12-8]|uniref:hypothetical protein n=1 Tax=Nonomuraea sp. LPB2021202275-12-8 TaxID=3120159 RepID=UPI00300C660C
MTSESACECHAPDKVHGGPCRKHESDKYEVWLDEKYPVYAACRGDGFVDHDGWPTDAADVPQFQPLREALSAPARERFDWEWSYVARWSQHFAAYEMAVTIRDAWRTLVLGYERDALRYDLMRISSREEYPIGKIPNFHEGTEPFVPKHLLHEANLLAGHIRCAQRIERMLRDHAAGGTIRADQL